MSSCAQLKRPKILKQHEARQKNHENHMSWGHNELSDFFQVSEHVKRINGILALNSQTLDISIQVETYLHRKKRTPSS